MDDNRTYVRTREESQVTERQSQPEPYRSARDLPSVAEMLEQMRGMKALTLFVGRKHRKGILELERQVEELVSVVDRFYELLGDRHWIFHDRLNVEKVKALLDLPPDEAEKGLIEMYRDDEWPAFRPWACVD